MNYVRLDTIVAALLGFMAIAFLLDRSPSTAVWLNPRAVGIAAATGSAKLHFPQSQLASRKRDFSASDISTDAGQILVLYQITAGEHWQYIVEDQFMKLMFSGLYPQLSRIYCTVSSSFPNGTELISEVLSGFGSKFSIIELPEEYSLSEAIATMTNLTFTDRVLFLSTYGANSEVDSTAYERDFQRRTFMEYEMIKNHQQRLDELLDNGIVGESRFPYI